MLITFFTVNHSGLQVKKSVNNAYFTGAKWEMCYLEHFDSACTAQNKVHTGKIMSLGQPSDKHIHSATS